jgi:MoxR-like ATPase
VGLSKYERERIDELSEVVAELRAQLGRRIVGLDSVVDHLLQSLLVGGHTLLIGVPGLAKTLLISSLAEAFALSFKRIQFTPDLMPSDITGTDIITVTEDRREFSFREGPLFANIVLADEINRTPPKTQAALMEAMEEGQVSCGGRSYGLPEPFFVLATQNPIEQEGTYPLPVAQLDRFMFSVALDYPSFEDEYKILRMTTSGYRSKIDQMISRDQVLEAMRIVRRIEASDELVRYVLRLVRSTRGRSGSAPAYVREWLSWGCGPRAAQAVVLGAKARAMLAGRVVATPEDVRAVVPAVLRHRALISFHAESDGLTIDEVLEELVERIEAPDGYGSKARSRGFLAGLLR